MPHAFAISCFHIVLSSSSSSSSAIQSFSFSSLNVLRPSIIFTYINYWPWSQVRPALHKVIGQVIRIRPSRSSGPANRQLVRNGTSNWATFFAFVFGCQLSVTSPVIHNWLTVFFWLGTGVHYQFGLAGLPVTVGLLQ